MKDGKTRPLKRLTGTSSHRHRTTALNADRRGKHTKQYTREFRTRPLFILQIRLGILDARSRSPHSHQHQRTDHKHSGGSYYQQPIAQEPGCCGEKSFSEGSDTGNRIRHSASIPLPHLQDGNPADPELEAQIQPGSLPHWTPAQFLWRSPLPLEQQLFLQEDRTTASGKDTHS